MKTALVYWLSRMMDALVSVSKALGVLVAFLLWVGLILEKVVAAGLQQIIGRLNSVQLSEVRNVTLASMEWIGYVNAIIPLSEMIALLIAFFTACLTVVTIRWIKSFIPTVAN